MIKEAHLLTSSRRTSMIFVDFRDSFTYNILAYLKHWGDIKVISPSEVESYLRLDYSRFVWGPGPGLADDYFLNFDLIKESLNNKTQKHFGICLGHQLIARSLGGIYRKLDNPKHGMSEKILLPEWMNWGLTKSEIDVQFYNSLVVDINETVDLRVFKHHNDVLMLSSDRLISCQFHPESVGTSCPETFFSNVMQNFL